MGARHLKPKPEPGARFGRLVVLERDLDGPNGRGVHLRWACLCDCGERTIARADNLRAGATTSCGCRRQELNDERRLFYGEDQRDYLRHLWETRGTLYGPLDDIQAERERKYGVRLPRQRRLAEFQGMTHSALELMAEMSAARAAAEPFDPIRPGWGGRDATDD